MLAKCEKMDTRFYFRENSVSFAPAQMGHPHNSASVTTPQMKRHPQPLDVFIHFILIGSLYGSLAQTPEPDSMVGSYMYSLSALRQQVVFLSVPQSPSVRPFRNPRLEVVDGTRKL